MKNVFITGASGFWEIICWLSADVRILAQYYTTAPAITSSNIDCLQMDYANPDWTQVQHFQPDTIIHCGAMTQIDKCEQRPAAAVTANLTFTKYLCDVANLTGARFVFISADQVYDGEADDYTETDTANPVNRCGKIKLAAETFVLGNHPNAVVARSAVLIYGKSLHGKVTFTESMIGRLREGLTVNVFEDEFAHQS
ncbi:MAG: sugar nucleotide-binding protein [Calditrichia bacterium]